MTFGNFVRDQLYHRRRDLHALYRGQQQGGIITPARQPVIFAITGESGLQHGYHDGWTEDGKEFRYYGEGQVGDMTFTAGNKAIRDHVGNGKDLLLFEKRSRTGLLRFRGQFVCDHATRAQAPDREGNMRSAIIFHLVPMEAFDEPIADEPRQPDQPPRSLAELRMLAMVAATNGTDPPAEGARRRIYRRSNAVRDYVLARAAGVCECCGQAAPFLRPDGDPYLEPHHIRRVSDGGPDDPRFVAGICPTCHRRIHHGVDGQTINTGLAERILQKEHALAPSEERVRKRRRRTLVEAA